MAKSLDPTVKAVNAATRKVEASKARIAKLKETIVAETAVLNGAKDELAVAKAAAKAAK